MSVNKKSIFGKILIIAVSLSLGLLMGCFISTDKNKTNELTDLELDSNQNTQSTQDSEKDLGAIVAKINGNPVYKADVDEKLSAMIPGQEIDFNDLDEAIKQMIIKEIATDRIILKRAYEQNFQENAKVLAVLESKKNEIIKDEFLQEIARKNVTDKVVEQKYSKEVASLEGKLQYKVSHILVKTKSEANEVKKLLNTKKFSEVAKEKSIDRQTAEKGGDVGYMIDGVMVPDFESAVKKLEVGQISSPVKTRFGWHIIKLFKTKPVEVPELEAVKESISQMLYQEAINDFNENLANNVNIELIDNNIEQEQETIEQEDEDEIDEE